jgi:hypothetical protein
MERIGKASGPKDTDLSYSLNGCFGLKSLR